MTAGQAPPPASLRSRTSRGQDITASAERPKLQGRPLQTLPEGDRTAEPGQQVQPCWGQPGSSRPRGRTGVMAPLGGHTAGTVRGDSTMDALLVRSLCVCPPMEAGGGGALAGRGGAQASRDETSSRFPYRCPGVPHGPVWNGGPHWLARKGTHEPASGKGAARTVQALETKPFGQASPWPQLLVGAVPSTAHPGPRSSGQL